MTYEADEKGYRVTGMESRPVGDGPMGDQTGRAIVQQLVSGVETQYAIRAEPVDEPEGDGAATVKHVAVDQEGGSS